MNHIVYPSSPPFTAIIIKDGPRPHLEQDQIWASSTIHCNHSLTHTDCFPPGTLASENCANDAQLLPPINNWLLQHCLFCRLQCARWVYVNIYNERSISILIIMIDKHWKSIRDEAPSFRTPSSSSGGPLVMPIRCHRISESRPSCCFIIVVKWTAAVGLAGLPDLLILFQNGFF